MKKFRKHLGDCYKVMSGYETAQMIIKTFKETNTPLTHEQELNLMREFGDGGMNGNLDMPFLAYRWETEKPSGTFLYRLTIPFYFIVVLLFICIVLPIKWIITGKYSLSQDSRIGEFITQWDNKIHNGKRY